MCRKDHWWVCNWCAAHHLDTGESTTNVSACLQTYRDKCQRIIDPNKDIDLLSMHIYTVECIKTMLNRELDRNNLSENRHAKYEASKHSLNTFQYAKPMFCQEDVDGGSETIFIERVSWVFLDQNVNFTAAPKGDEHQPKLLWLTTLHKHEAVHRHQEHNYPIKSACAYCHYWVDSHYSINDHIQIHYRMGLMCAKCLHVEIRVEAMIKHGKDNHKVVLLR